MHNIKVLVLGSLLDNLFKIITAPFSDLIYRMMQMITPNINVNQSVLIVIYTIVVVLLNH